MKTTIFIILLLILIFYFICTKQNYQLIKEKFSQPKNKKWDLAIMSIFKNEESYMEEWLDHHIAQGFDQIFLYCNDPNLSKYPYLKDLPNSKYKNYVTLIDWVNKVNQGRNTVQKQAYAHCVNNYGNDCQFLMMLDIDEFVHAFKDFKNIKQFIKSLDNWEKIRSFKIHRFNFGSDGHIEKPNLPVTQAYTKHEKICSSFKTLVNTDYVQRNVNFYGVHDFPYNGKTGKIYNPYLNYFKTGFDCGCEKDDINEIPIVINHYYTKSYQEYMNRCKLWENGGINPINYRKNCDKLFKSKDVGETSELQIKN